MKNAFLPLDLERLLVRDVKVWVQDFELKSPEDRGAHPIPVQVVQGFVPSFQAGPKMPAQNKAPVIAIRAVGGSYIRLKGECDIHFFILTWDDNPDRSGYRDSMNLSMVLVQRLYEAGLVDKSFVLLDDPVHWNLIEDLSKDYFPYFIYPLKHGANHHLHRPEAK